MKIIIIIIIATHGRVSVEKRRQTFCVLEDDMSTHTWNFNGHDDENPKIKKKKMSFVNEGKQYKHYNDDN